MNNERVSKIFGILAYLIVICLFIKSIVSEEVTAIVVSGLLLVFFSVVFVFLVIFDYKFNNQKNMKVKKYRKIRNKENKSIFEELFIKAFQNKLDDEIREITKEFDIKNIKNFEVELIDKETIHIYYRYNRFTVYTYIKDDKVSYHIDTPEEYDGTKENKLFESKKYFSKKINDYNSVKEFLNEFALVTSSIQNDVNTFVDNNIVDDVFNGRLYHKLLNFSKVIKLEGFLCSILGFIMIGFFIYMFYLGIFKWEYDGKLFATILGIIMCLFLTLFLFYMTFYGLQLLKIWFGMIKDIENREVCTIKDEVIKVKIKHDEASRYSRIRYIRYIKVYFKDLSVYIPFSNNEILNNPENIKKCVKECMIVNRELTYLKRSKVVIKGDNAFYAIVKKHLL